MVSATRDDAAIDQLFGIGIVVRLQRFGILDRQDFSHRCFGTFRVLFDEMNRFRRGGDEFLHHLGPFFDQTVFGEQATVIAGKSRLSKR